MGVEFLYVWTNATNQNNSVVYPLSDSGVDGRRWREGGGPWNELRGFLSKDWSANSGEIAAEGNTASSFQPIVDAESIISLSPESTDWLTSFSSYFEVSSTESENGEISETEIMSSKDLKPRPIWFQNLWYITNKTTIMQMRYEARLAWVQSLAFLYVLAIIRENNILGGRSVEFEKSYFSHKSVAIEGERTWICGGKWEPRTRDWWIW